MNTFLVGKTINKIMIAEDKQALLFSCEDGEHIARTDGDCCSYSWVEHIELPALGFPATVQSVDDLPMPQVDSSENKDGEICVYGCKITTDRGEIIIDYRNLSNGYYGGNLAWPNSHFYGGVHGQNISNEDWREIA